MAPRKVNSSEHIKIEKFFRHPSKSYEYDFPDFFTYSSFSLCISFRKTEFQLLGAFSGVHHMTEVGCFFKIVKIHFFCCFITQLVKKPTTMVYV